MGYYIKKILAGGKISFEVRDKMLHLMQFVQGRCRIGHKGFAMWLQGSQHRLHHKVVFNPVFVRDKKRLPQFCVPRGISTSGSASS